MNPFDLRTALLAKHAQHVVLIHFPIALFIAGVIFDFLAQRAKWRALAEVAYSICSVRRFPWCLWSPPDSLPGSFSSRAKNLKAFCSCIWFWVAPRQSSSGLHGLCICDHATNFKGATPIFRLGLETVAVAIVGLTGHLGGFLSGVNGPN